jgi:23S rRNA (cytosine1962-C5)-methyltransferase
LRILAQEHDYVVVDGPAGALDLAPVAAALSVGLDELHPVGELDPEVGGVQLVARSPEARERLAAALSSGAASLEFRAITANPPWRDGILREEFADRPAETRFEVVATRGAVSELALLAGAGGARQIRFHLARAGIHIAGDARHASAPAAGGLRLWSARLRIPAEGVDIRAAEPCDFWPPEPVFAPEHPRPTLVVSHATALALRRGHPWIVADADTSDVGRHRPGTLARVSSVRGEHAGVARIEGRGRIAARLWATATRSADIASVEERVAAALERRRDILEDVEIEALRLIHGEADGLPGLAVDRLGPVLRILVTGRACEPIVDRVLNALVRPLAAALGPDPPVVRVVHLAEPPAGRLRGVEVIRGTLDGVALERGRIRVGERGLSFWVDPGVGDPYRPRPGTGLFLDQRENRARLARAAAGGRWLNLFCHTGGFSAAALAAGAREVVSVDLSAPYLHWLEANLALNGLAGAPHRSVRMDARRYLEGPGRGDTFDGIVFDPPTAARAGRRFWSVRRDGGTMLDACLRQLRAGGTLLACRNDRGSRGSLRSLVRAVADAAGIALASVEAAPPGPDFPRLAAFPEGDAFEGAIAIRK